MKKNKTKKIALFGLFVALAFVFSYFESMIPFNFGIPGVKLGLANIVVLVALYTMKPTEAFAIAVVRIVLVGLTFGNLFSLAYSLCGGILSYVVMLITKKTKLSIIGVSMLGGVCHNLGQIIVAGFIMKNVKIAYYFPVLMIAGLVTGLLMGVIARIVVDRFKKVNK